VLRVKDVDAAVVGVSVAVKLQCTWPLKLKLKRSDCDGTAGSLIPFMEPTNNIYISYSDVFVTFLLYPQVAPSEHCSNMSPNLVKAQIRGARSSVSRISSPGCIPSPTYLPAPPYSVLSPCVSQLFDRSTNTATHHSPRPEPRPCRGMPAMWAHFDVVAREMVNRTPSAPVPFYASIHYQTAIGAVRVVSAQGSAARVRTF
jgi:hypothetical protein